MDARHIPRISEAAEPMKTNSRLAFYLNNSYVGLRAIYLLIILWSRSLHYLNLYYLYFEEWYLPHTVTYMRTYDDHHYISL